MNEEKINKIYILYGMDFTVQMVDDFYYDPKQDNREVVATVKSVEDAEVIMGVMRKFNGKVIELEPLLLKR